MKPLELAGIRVEGLSIGGIETFLGLPQFKLAFDIGRCPPEAVRYKHILFTHAHMDHMGGVAYHAATRALRRMPAPTYVLPHTEVAGFEALFAAWRQLDGSDLPHTRVALRPGDEHVLRKDLIARPFRSPHRAPCQGYLVSLRRRKLDPEFADLPPGAIASLRREGRRITRDQETVEVAFTGDTRIDVLDTVPELRTARLLILETTFLDDRVSVDECRSKGHVHLDEVLARADLFQNEAILLTHFSARYRARDVRGILNERLPPSLAERVTPLLEGFA